MIQIDVRPILPRDRHPMIFDAFDSLALGEAIELVNDHSPMPLYYQFLHERTGLFQWQALEEGPRVWRIEITRIA
jgi:uncharacterized protein (DUF2249 family)